MTDRDDTGTADAMAQAAQKRCDIGVWMVPAAEQYITRTAQTSGIDFCGVGSTDEAVARNVAATLNAEVFDDVRTGPSTAPCTALLAADQSLDHMAQLRAGRAVFTLEPWSPVEHGGQQPILLGSFIEGTGFRAAQQVLPDFGAIASVHVVNQCGVGQGSLAARLHDAMLTLHMLLGPPELLDAMLIAQNAAQSDEPARAHVELTPERLDGLAGDIGVLARFQPRAVGTIAASDRGPWIRRVHLVGAGGTLEIDEVGVTWRDTQGAVLEQHDPVEDSFGAACQQAGAELQNHLAGRESIARHIDPLDTYAACEAVRLSCRTRAPESTSKLRELLERT